MTASLLNDITRAYIAALQQGQQTLAAFAIPLLAFCALVEYVARIAPLVAFSGGGSNVGDVLAQFLLLIIRIGIFHWLMVNLAPLATAAYQTFLQWGMAPTAGAFTDQTFLQPASLVDLGFRIAGDIYAMGEKLSLWSRMNHPWLLWGYSIAYWAIIASFAMVALHLLMTVIEFHLAVMVGTVLIPWGVLSPTAFFSEFAIGWVTGGLVRVLTTGAMVGIGHPLFAALTTTPTDGGDPTTYSAAVLGIAGVIYAVISWVVPGRAASIAGRGVSLALHGGAVMAGAAGGMRFVMMGAAAVRGASNMVQRMAR